MATEYKQGEAPKEVASPPNGEIRTPENVEDAVVETKKRSAKNKARDTKGTK